SRMDSSTGTSLAAWARGRLHAIASTASNSHALRAASADGDHDIGDGAGEFIAVPGTRTASGYRLGDARAGADTAIAGVLTERSVDRGSQRQPAPQPARIGQRRRA